MASNPRGIASAGSCQRITRSPRRPIRSGVRRWQSGSVLVANRRKPSCRLPKWSQHPQSGVAANRDRQPRSSLRAAARSEHRKPSGLYPVASVLYPIHREGALRGRKGRGTMAGGPTHVFDYPSGAARFYIMDDFVYSLNGQAAFWISCDYWYPYPSSGTPAFWVRGKFIYDNPPSGTPKYYMP
jgi:hypothetical protein